jgi:uncharacterized protein
MSSSSSSSSSIAAFVSRHGHPPAVLRTLRLLVLEDCTVPFVVRYRQEATGGAQGAAVGAWLLSFRDFQALRKKARAAVAELEARADGSLTPGLRQKFHACASLQELEDLWLPFRKERSSRAQKAAALQLEPVARRVWSQAGGGKEGGGGNEGGGGGSSDSWLYRAARDAVAREENLHSQEDVFAGVVDILANFFSQRPEVRVNLRRLVWSNGMMRGKLKKTATASGTGKPTKAAAGKHSSSSNHGRGKKTGVYDFYDDWSCNLRSVRPHQTLALERGAREKALTVTIKIRPLNDNRGGHSSYGSSSSPETPAERLRRYVVRQIRSAAGVPFHKDKSRRRCERLLDEAAAEAWTRLVRPALFREARKSLMDNAEKHAISCFASNLSSLLLQPPLPAARPDSAKSVAMRTVLGVDPGFRAGCKLAAVDAQGRVLDTCTVYPHPPRRRTAEAHDVMKRLCMKHGIGLIAIGNGTASRETEALIADMIARWRTGSGAPSSSSSSSSSSTSSTTTNVPQYANVNEAGASVYSTSTSASKEFGANADPLAIGAVSIARRLQDPLSELVKIPPQSIGVGMYQHDVSEKKLADRLEQVVSNVVSDVGVRANSASLDVLRHVSGLNASRAKKIHAHVRASGPLECRKDILKIAGIGKRTYEQCAGFLRIAGGSCPLDNTNVHPESYDVARAVLGLAGCTEFSLVVSSSNSLSKSSAVSAKLGALTDAQLSRVADAEGVSLQRVCETRDFLKKPGALSDPRRGLPGAVMRSGPMGMSELRVGMVLPGTVRSLTSFGAFVDIGVGQDGLLHSKQIERSTSAMVGAGSTLNVTVLAVDPQRKRISLGLEGQSISATGGGASIHRPSNNKKKKQAAAPSRKQAQRPKQQQQQPPQQPRRQQHGYQQQQQQLRKQPHARKMSSKGSGERGGQGHRGKPFTKGRSRGASSSSSSSTQVIDLTSSRNSSKKNLADRITARKITSNNSGSAGGRRRDSGGASHSKHKPSLEERILSRKQGFKKKKHAGGTKRGRDDFSSSGSKNANSKNAKRSRH